MEVVKVEDCGINMGDYDIPIYNAIIIPTGATNRDMLKAVFPKLFCEQTGEFTGMSLKEW